LRLFDSWLKSKHRYVNSDSTNIEDELRLFDSWLESNNTSANNDSRNNAISGSSRSTNTSDSSSNITDSIQIEPIQKKKRERRRPGGNMRKKLLARKRLRDAKVEEKQQLYAKAKKQRLACTLAGDLYNCECERKPVDTNFGVIIDTFKKHVHCTQRSLPYNIFTSNMHPDVKKTFDIGHACGSDISSMSSRSTRSILAHYTSIAGLRVNQRVDEPPASYWNKATPGSAHKKKEISSLASKISRISS
jgi:hypothetical protein